MHQKSPSKSSEIVTAVYTFIGQLPFVTCCSTECKRQCHSSKISFSKA